MLKLYKSDTVIIRPDEKFANYGSNNVENSSNVIPMSRASFNRAVDNLIGEGKIPAELREEFSSAVRSLVDKFQEVAAKSSLPEKPLRDIISREGIINYLRSPEGMGPWLEANALTRPILRSMAPKAYIALNNYLRKNDLPEDIRMPTLSEALDAEVIDPIALRAAQRISAGGYRRSRKFAERQAERKAGRDI